MPTDPKKIPGMRERMWKPGQSGNPAGRPKRESFEAIVARVLDERVPGNDARKRELVARVFVDEMLKRNSSMIREYMDREWPKTLHMDATVDGQITVSTEDRDAAKERLVKLIGRKAG